MAVHADSRTTRRFLTDCHVICLLHTVHATSENHSYIFVETLASKEKEGVLMPDEKDISRRRFLQYTGLVTGAGGRVGPSTVSMAAEQGGTAHSGHAAATAQPLNRARMSSPTSWTFHPCQRPPEADFPQRRVRPRGQRAGRPLLHRQPACGQPTATTRGNTSPGLTSRALPAQGYQTPLVRQ